MASKGRPSGSTSRHCLIKDEAIMESLVAFKRAGASAIITYFALEIAKKLKSF